MIVRSDPLLGDAVLFHMDCLPANRAARRSGVRNPRHGPPGSAGTRCPRGKPTGLRRRKKRRKRLRMRRILHQMAGSKRALKRNKPSHRFPGGWLGAFRRRSGSDQEEVGLRPGFRFFGRQGRDAARFPFPATPIPPPAMTGMATFRHSPCDERPYSERAIFGNPRGRNPLTKQTRHTHGTGRELGHGNGSGPTPSRLYAEIGKCSFKLKACSIFTADLRLL